MATATDLKGLADRAVKEISSAADEAALEAVRVRYLSRKDGLITAATKEIATLPAAEKPGYGKAVNEAKGRLIPLEEMPTIEKVAAGLNAIGVTPRDMMSIFQAMKQAGALQAELIMR